MIIRYLGGCKICFDFICQVSLPQQEQVLYNFCLCSCINNSCMEIQSVGVTYNRLVVSKAGDFTVHMSHMIYFSKTSENRSSENDPLLDILSLVGHSPNPLSMISVSNMRHSQAPSCISPVLHKPVGKGVTSPHFVCVCSRFWGKGTIGLFCLWRGSLTMFSIFTKHGVLQSC